MEITEKTFKAVCEQRDQMMKVVYNLVDAFWSAHHNQAFKAEKALDENLAERQV